MVVHRLFCWCLQNEARRRDDAKSLRPVQSSDVGLGVICVDGFGCGLTCFDSRSQGMTLRL